MNYFIIKNMDWKYIFDLYIKTILAPLVCRRDYFILMSLVYNGVHNVLTILVILQVSYKRQPLLTLRKDFITDYCTGSAVLIFLVLCLLFCLSIFLCLEYPMFPVSLDCPFCFRCGHLLSVCLLNDFLSHK